MLKTAPFSFVEVPDLSFIPTVPISEEGRTRIAEKLSNFERYKEPMADLTVSPWSDWNDLPDLPGAGDSKEIRLVCLKETFVSFLRDCLKEGKEPDGHMQTGTMKVMTTLTDNDTVHSYYDGYSVLSSEKDVIVKEAENAVAAHRLCEELGDMVEGDATVRFGSKDKGVITDVRKSYTDINLAALFGLDDGERRPFHIGFTGDKLAEGMNFVCCCHPDGKPYPSDRALTLHEFRYPVYSGEYSAEKVAEYSVWAMFRRDADAEMSFAMARMYGMAIDGKGNVTHLTEAQGKEIRSLIGAGHPTGRETTVGADAIPKAFAYRAAVFEVTAYADGGGVPAEKVSDGYSKSVIPHSNRRGNAPNETVVIRKRDLPLLSDPSFPDNADIIPSRGMERCVSFNTFSPTAGKEVTQTKCYLYTEVVPKGGKGIAEEAMEKIAAMPEAKGVRMEVNKNRYSGGMSPEAVREAERKYVEYLREDLRSTGAYYRGEKKILLHPSLADVGKKEWKSYLGHPIRKVFKHEMKRLEMGLSPEEYEKRFLKKGKKI